MEKEVPDLRDVILLLSEKGFERLPGQGRDIGYARCYEMVNRRGKIPTVVNILYIKEEEKDRIISITMTRSANVTFEQIKKTDFRKETKVWELFEEGR